MENNLLDEAKMIYRLLGITYSEEQVKFEEVAEKFIWPSYYSFYPSFSSTGTGSSNSSCYSLREINNAKLERTSN
jgi:hypothetical protein